MIKLSSYAKLLTRLDERYGNQKKLRGIWYHGSSSKNLKSILSNGLVPYPKERVWDGERGSGTVLSQHSLSLESYGGIYMTRRLTTAYSAAINSAHKTKTHPIVVVLSMTPKNLVLDEDTLSNFFISYPQDILIPHYKTMVYGGTQIEKKELHEEQKRFVDKCVSHICNTYNIKNESLINRLKHLISTEGFPAVVYRSASHAPSYLWNSAFYDYKEKIPNKPHIDESEKKYRDFVDKITKTLKFILLKSPSTKYNDNMKFNPEYIHGRSLEPIRFNGKNKIISIFEFTKSEILQFATDVHLKYGIIPNDFVSQYKTIDVDFTADKIIIDKN